MKKANAFILILTFLGITPNLSHSQGTIHDAVFSPDGSLIAVGGTKGVYLYRLDGIELVDTIQTPNDVQFIRWSPDLLHLFVAQWDESIPDSNVTYSIIDVKDKSILYDITDNIRWVGRLIIYDTYQDFETYDRPKKEASHPNTFVFSTSGDNFAYIDADNQIVIGDTQTGKIVKILNSIDSPVIPSDDTLSAIGYISEEEMYACTYNGRNFSIGNDQFTENLIQDKPVVKYYPTPQQTIFISKNWDNMISLSPVSMKTNLDGSFERSYELFLHRRKVYDTFEYSFIRIFGVYANQTRQRAIYFGDEKRIMVLTHSKKEDYFSDLSDAITMIIINNENWEFQYNNSIGKHAYGQSTKMNIILLQPFSPDGNYILLLQNENLYLIKALTFESRIILPKNTAVSNYMEMSEN